MPDSVPYQMCLWACLHVLLHAPKLNVHLPNEHLDDLGTYVHVHTLRYIHVVCGPTWD